MEVRPKQQKYTTELMESKKQTSMGLLLCEEMSSHGVLEAQVKEDATSMGQRSRGANQYAQALIKPVTL